MQRYITICITCILACSVRALGASNPPGEPAGADSSQQPGMLQLHTGDSLSTRNGGYIPAWHGMISNLPGDWVSYGRKTFTVENIPAILGMTAATAALIATDERTWEAADRWYRTSSAVRTSSDALEFIGDGKFQFGVAAVFAGYGFAFRDARALRTASQTVEAILACGAAVQLLKHVTGRESPFVSTRSGGDWRFFPNQIDYFYNVPHYDAFPSGHIATAMTTLTVIAENYPELTWLKPAGYSLLALVAASLVTTGIHWWSDIPLGVALGYTFGMIAAHPEAAQIVQSNGNRSPSVSLVPFISPFGMGARLSAAF